eukprot:4161088-Amphidinium_carterae.1
MLPQQRSRHSLTRPQALAAFEVADRAVGLCLHSLRGKVVLLCLRADLYADWRHWLANHCAEVSEALDCVSCCDLGMQMTCGRRQYLGSQPSSNQLLPAAASR